MNEGKGEIVIYESREGNDQIEVKLEGESQWLSQRLMAELFEKDSDTIGLHIKNIYEDEELKENSPTEIFPVVQQEGKRKVKREVKFYNLDVILSVGYRVSSKRGTAFRIWTNTVIKNYLAKGYAIDKKKFQEQSRQLDVLRSTFQGSLAAVYQTFAGKNLYLSAEEKTANLLYFVIKNHSFSDGNKRISAFLFVWFLEMNGILYRPDGSKKISDNALVALTLMIAESKPEEKDMMIKVLVNLINLKN